MESNLETVDELVSCPFCGEGNSKESRFCVRCGKSLAGRKRANLKKRNVFLGVISLLLVGGIVFFSVNGVESRLVGKVNGEGITREEFSKRVERMRRLYESRYGENLFQGEAGKQNLNRLKTDILDEIVAEKILLQEAKNAGYTSAPGEEIEKQFEAVKTKNRLSDGDLEKMFGSVENFKGELGKEWIISQFLEKSVLKGNQGNGSLVIAQWFEKAKANAKIEAYEKWESVPAARASCCTSGCGGGKTVQPLDPKTEQEAKAKGLEYYEQKTQKKGAEARVTNFGCHIQVDIVDQGKVVLSLTYRQGEVQEI
jgi:D-Tyr-tRNAtyr deacylase